MLLKTSENSTRMNYLFLVVFAVCFLFSYLLDAHRIAVLILGCFALLSVLAMVILYICIFNGKKKLDIPMIITALIMLFFHAGQYKYIADSSDHPEYTILIPIVLAALLSVLAVIKNIDIKKVKDYIFFFAIFFIGFAILFIPCYFYINYAFDTSAPQETECVIISQIDEGHTNTKYFSHTYISYSVECKSDEISITQIELPDTVRLSAGDTVKITYHKGLIRGIFCTEYDPEPLDPGPLQ